MEKNLKTYTCVYIYVHQFSSVHSLSHVRLFATPWTAAHQASLSITNSQRLLKLMSIELVMPSNHLILCRPPLLLPSIFGYKEHIFTLLTDNAKLSSQEVVPVNPSTSCVNPVPIYPLPITVGNKNFFICARGTGWKPEMMRCECHQERQRWPGCSPYSRWVWLRLITAQQCL